MKYWNTLFLSSPLLDLYLPKLGILSVPVDAMPLNGESNDEVGVVSTLRFWMRAEEARMVGNCCRTQLRRSVLAGLVRPGISRMVTSEDEAQLKLERRAGGRCWTAQRVRAWKLSLRLW